MKLRKLITACLLLSLAGCATPGDRMRDICLGMEREQVVDIMGEPDAVSARRGQEILSYKHLDKNFHHESYLVVFENGTVVEFGRAEDLAPTGGRLPVGRRP